MLSQTKDTNSFYNGYDLNDPYEEIKIRPYQYGAQYKQKQIKITKIILDEEKKEKILNENIENMINIKKKVEEESKESVDEINKINDAIKKLEDKLELDRLNLIELKTKYGKLKTETKDDLIKRTFKEHENVRISKENYDKIKKEFDECKVPNRVDQPNRNAPKSEINKFNKLVEERDKIISRKNQLTISLRNREIDFQNAEAVLKKAMDLPSEKELLDKEIKQKQKEYEKNMSEINDLRSQLRKHHILLSKLELCDANIKKANDEKFAYKMRGMTVITKDGVLNYDKNGKLIKENPNKKLMNDELINLQLNPPMKETRGFDFMVSNELNFLKSYYASRCELVNKYNTSKDPDTQQWVKNNELELEDTKEQIKKLESKYYNDNIWLEIDEELYDEKRREIYTKYGFIYQEDNHHYKPKEEIEKKYTMDDFMRSIGKK